MAAPKGNKFASKEGEMDKIIPLFLDHLAKGLSKKSFVECDWRTIEKYVDDLSPLKKSVEVAERTGRKYWEELGQDITSGKKRGNPATWIFTMKNKYPDDWKDKSEIEANVVGNQITKVIYE